MSLVISIMLINAHYQPTPMEMLFSSDRNGNSDIFLMVGDADAIRQITSSSAEEWAPSWVNGEEISYLRQRDTQPIEIVVHHLGTNETRLVPHPTRCILDDKNYLYSGTQKVFTCNGEIYWNDAVGTSYNITANLTGKSNYPSWSPDGQTILFTNNSSGNNELYQYNILDQSTKKITDNPANDERGELGPNSKYVIFSSDRFEPGNQEICLMNLETREVTNITNNSAFELIGRWSRDGKYIWFGSNRTGNWEIYRYLVESGETTQLTNHPGFDGDPRVR